jgi:hypothetical protein
MPGPVVRRMNTRCLSEMLPCDVASKFARTNVCDCELGGCPPHTESTWSHVTEVRCEFHELCAELPVEAAWM